MFEWVRKVRLSESRAVIEGSFQSFTEAILRGADMRGYTTFDYGEHMSIPESSEGLVQESMAFSVVYCMEDRHVAGIQTLRWPANCSLGLTLMPSMSFFLNNMDARNGVARLFLDGTKGKAKPQSSQGNSKYRVIDAHDELSCCPSENFTYDFGEYGWWVNDCWTEVLAQRADGGVISGSLETLQDAFRNGQSVKVGVKNLCSYLAGPDAIEHEVFTELHSIYNHQDAGYLGGESLPIVRVAPSVPLRYESGNWDCGWILPRTDGMVDSIIIDPLTRQIDHRQGQFAMRWFVK